MELLAPAGNLEKLKTAILYGADAVYLAGDRFSLRGGADNFSDTELQEGVNFVHENQAKAYVTLNAFLHDSELSQLPEYVRFLEQVGVDGVIVSDLGVMTTVQENSKIPVHVSTQASCLNVASAKVWKKFGAKRLILGREVTVSDAAKIRKEVGIEVELFIHGAMCMAYAGNCTISNYTSGRDSNRGGCVQSCRFSYSAQPHDQNAVPDFSQMPSKPLMSSKDLRGINLLPQFLEAGIDSIKVEGRMKSTLYVATTTSAYRNALFACENSNKKDWPIHLDQWSRMLEKIPHRGYSEAALQKERAGAESIYQGGRNARNSGYEIAGTVLEVNEGESFIMQTQNPFNTDTVLEVLTFSGECIAIPALGMQTLNEEPVTRSKPSKLLKIRMNPEEGFKSEGIEPFNVIRYGKKQE